MRNGEANASAPQQGPIGLTCVPFIGNDAVRTPFGATWSLAFDGSLVKEREQVRCLMRLAGREDEGEGLTTPLSAQVNLGTEAAATAP